MEVYLHIHRPSSPYFIPLQEIKQHHAIKYIAQLHPNVFIIRTDIAIEDLRQIPGVFDAGSIPSACRTGAKETNI